MFVWFASLFAHWSIDCSRYRFRSLACKFQESPSLISHGPVEFFFQAALLCRSVGKRRVKQGKVAKVLRHASTLDQLKQVTGKDSTIPLEKYRTDVGDRFFLPCVRVHAFDLQGLVGGQ